MQQAPSAESFIAVAFRVFFKFYVSLSLMFYVCSVLNIQRFVWCTFEYNQIVEACSDIIQWRGWDYSSTSLQWTVILQQIFLGYSFTEHFWSFKMTGLQPALVQPPWTLILITFCFEGILKIVEWIRRVRRGSVNRFVIKFKEKKCIF